MTIVSGIVKVCTPGYRPTIVKVRADLGPTLFTADFDLEHLSQLESDSEVVSVAVSERLPLIKEPSET